MAKLPKRVCLCGRMIAVRYESQRHAGGKARARHKCPHGNPCVAGLPTGGEGFNRNSACEQCRECAEKSSRDPKTVLKIPAARADKE